MSQCRKYFQSIHFIQFLSKTIHFRVNQLFIFYSDSNGVFLFCSIMHYIFWLMNCIKRCKCENVNTYSISTLHISCFPNSFHYRPIYFLARWHCNQIFRMKFWPKSNNIRSLIDYLSSKQTCKNKQLILTNNGNKVFRWHIFKEREKTIKKI